MGGDFQRSGGHLGGEGPPTNIYFPTNKFGAKRNCPPPRPRHLVTAGAGAWSGGFLGGRAPVAPVGEPALRGRAGCWATKAGRPGVGHRRATHCGSRRGQPGGPYKDAPRKYFSPKPACTPGPPCARKIPPGPTRWLAENDPSGACPPGASGGGSPPGRYTYPTPAYTSGPPCTDKIPP